MNSTYYLVIAAVIAVASIPLIAKAVPPNRLYGFRTPRTLSNERIWYSANRFAGWALLIAAVSSAASFAILPHETLSVPGLGAVVLGVPLLVAVVASFIYLRNLGEK